MNEVTSLATPDARDLYLDLLKKVLTRVQFPEHYRQLKSERASRNGIYALLRGALNPLGLELVRKIEFDLAKRAEGLDWPPDAESMIGLKRMDNLQHCVVDVLRNGVPGDLVETGVWRGGASIFMRAILKAYGDTERVVWLADSFQGLPKPDTEKHPADTGDRLWTWSDSLAIPVETVKANFERYGLLDNQVRFIEGWFRDTLPTAPIARIAVLRLDGDMYESTIDALTPLYPKVSVGGYVIVDDYRCIPACEQATEDYRAAHGITDEVIPIDQAGVYWRRTM